MNLKTPRYNQFALCREMLETADIIGKFDFSQTREVAATIKQAGKLFLSGEGSSRIFPAKSLISLAMSRGVNVAMATDGSLQATEYDLASWPVFVASNSGQTKEVVVLCQRLIESGHKNIFGLTAGTATKLHTLAKPTFVLSCGKEDAVAATKSVVEQGLFYRSMLAHWINCTSCSDARPQAAELARQTMTATIDASITEKLVAAPTIYFAGRNNGVAEELALKTNEITRKKSNYLEGTIVVHGIEEVMNRDDVVVLVDPYESEWAFIKKNLCDAIGMTVIAISPKPTIFPTLVVPELPGYSDIFQLMSGWNLLVETGTALGLNIDKPTRARKVGNECEG
ncbi:MAG: SIS domain-containing protein [Thermoguttaceae bacterium]